MTLRYEIDPPVDRRLADGICALWAAVTNAGGAVGFVPPVTAEEVRPELVRHLTAMAEGRARLLVARDEDGEPTGTAFLTFNTHRLMRHWVWLYTVMLHPDRQGRGEGRALMAAVEEAVRDMDGVRGIRLTCRGGMGLERFYEACGYKEVGRVPDAIKVTDDDFRDDITMWLQLR
ncbi:GNAT family N-acetyltransferase [Streptomyces megasporus]|uniref:GNAT family N-acetyltransferase n=1 Tax=Streptomyces megasporus TaxID=44060 RepID=UPI0004E14865|nr:GNAT family N-acetyltransferase [Streptomyces megasporus]